MNQTQTWPAWRYLWSLIRFRGRFFALNALLWVLYYAVPLVIGLIEKSVFDALSGHTAISLVWGLLVLMVIIWLSGALTSYGRILIDVIISFSAGALLRKNMLEYVLSRPGAGALPGSPGEAVTRFRDDVDEIMSTITLPVVLMVEALFALATLGIMIRINVIITLGVLVPFALVVVVTRALSSRLQHYRRLTRGATGDVTGFLGEVLGAVQAVKVAGSEGAIRARFRELNQARLRAGVRDSVLGATSQAIAGNAIQVAIAVLLLLAANSMRAGSFTVGDFALFVSYLEQLATIPVDLGRLLARLKQAGVSLSRMNELMPGAAPGLLVTPSAVYLEGRYPEIPFHSKPATDRFERLDVRGLTFHYPATDRGIGDISFTLRRGEIVAITGRIGSGKSTLLRVLLGLLPTDAGEVLWDGKVVTHLGEFMIPPHVSYVPQVPRLFADTVRNNILLGLPENRVGLREALRSAVLEDDLEAMPEGLDTLAGPRGVRLSGGQIQRVAAARMLVRQAELTLIDDLSSALDADTEELLWNSVLHGEEGTFLVVTHRPSALRRADRIIVLHDGEVEAEGTWQSLNL